MEALARVLALHISSDGGKNSVNNLLDPAVLPLFIHIRYGNYRTGLCPHMLDSYLLDLSGDLLQMFRSGKTRNAANLS